MKRNGKHLLTALVLIILLGCAPAFAQTHVFTDSLGRMISMEKPQRVVTLMGSFAEIWMLSGGQDSLVGTASDSTDTRDLGLPETVEIVGTYQSPNLEQIINLDPELVILSADTVRTINHLALKDTLEAAEIPAAYFKVTHFEDYLSMLRICTALTGDDAAYVRYGADVSDEIEHIIASGKRMDEPSVLLLITYSGGIRPQGSDTMTGRMLSELGCRNILDDYPSLLRDFSMEQIIEIDPDYVFVIPMGNDEEAVRKNLKESVESNPAWSGLTAVQNGRYMLLPEEQFLYKPNAAWAQSYAYLAQILNAGVENEK